MRVKLALSYAGFLLLAGVALFAVGFLILRFVPEGNVQTFGGGFAPNRSDLIAVFVRYAWWALAILAVIGLAGGWFLAGRMLTPLSHITAAARHARDGSLDHRIALPGRRDELTDLADTFDAMLGSLQRTIDEQRRFAANASHELRTPHAIVRTMVEVAQADREGRDVDTLLHRIASSNDRAIALTEALLALSRVEYEPLSTEPLDLAQVIRSVLDELATDAERLDVRVTTTLSSTTVTGDRTLLTQLVANLVRNAMTHNLDRDGAVEIASAMTPSGAQLTVANTGARIDPAVAATLTEPFVRGAGRTRSPTGHDGAGLGLAVVASIVRAHGGTLELTAPREGGLVVGVTLPDS